MSRHIVRDLFNSGEALGLNERQRILVTFAKKLTRTPWAVESHDLELARQSVADEGEFVEAVNVIAGFNFANRVADALGVPCEVPGFLRARRRIRYAVMEVMSWGMRLRMNFKNRTLMTHSPKDTLALLEQSLEKLGFHQLPGYLYRLACRPHVLAGHAAILSSLLGDSCFSPATLMRMEYVVSYLNGDSERLRESERQLEVMGCTADPLVAIAEGGTVSGHLPSREKKILRFARRVTAEAWTTSDEEVEALRRAGLSDREILDLVLLVAAYNSSNRMNLALVPRRKSARFEACTA